MALSRLARLFMGGTVIGAFVALSGCSTEDAASKEETAASFENELRLSGAKYLGTIESGQTKSTYYSDPPLYRSYGFSANPGDVVTVNVQSVYGDAVAWITTSSYDVLAMNDDASRSTLDSKIVYTVPAGRTSSSYRIVIRDYDRLGATFYTRLDIASAAPVTCSYGGKTFNSGETFPSTDRCNTCSCSSSGAVGCTKKACVCDPENEPFRKYVGTPSTCMTIRYSCQSGTHSFSNSCGCGCEDDY